MRFARVRNAIRSTKIQHFFEICKRLSNFFTQILAFMIFYCIFAVDLPNHVKSY